jgi:hypothetical protein
MPHRVRPSQEGHGKNVTTCAQTPFAKKTTQKRRPASTPEPRQSDPASDGGLSALTAFNQTGKKKLETSDHSALESRDILLKGE